ncbi:hypothetical protein TNCV_416511, partial [Trichonephila clavipes]
QVEAAPADSLSSHAKSISQRLVMRIPDDRVARWRRAVLPLRCSVQNGARWGNEKTKIRWERADSEQALLLSMDRKSLSGKPISEKSQKRV